MKNFLSKFRKKQDPYENKERFAGYYLVEKLGEGGFGDVYKAISVEDVERGEFVALKKLQETHGEEEKNRFRREIDILTSLSHPNVVKIMEGGEEENVLFFTMEVLEGCDLGKFIDNKKRELPETLSIVRQAAHGLHSAHVKGLVHRDVKPHNIFICNDGPVKVIDFGLAKDPQATVKVTLQKCIPGSPLYMPPEVMPFMQGQVEDIELTPAYDQFALGTIAFEMLTGGRPFVSPYQFPAGSLDLSSIQFESLKSVGDFGVDRAEALDPVLHKAMAQTPGDRYETVLDFVQALEAAANG